VLDSKSKAKNDRLMKENNEMRMLMNKEIRGEKRREIFELIRKTKRISLKDFNEYKL